jgi:hypothetical protein
MSILTIDITNTKEHTNMTSTIGFSFKVENIQLQTVDDSLRVTGSFVTRDLIDQINKKLRDQNFAVDENSLRSRYVDDQLYLEGFAMEIREAKTVGFLSGR